MKRLVSSLALILALTPGLRADPYVGYAYPSSVQAGSTNRLVVGGQRFWSLMGGWVSGEGVEVTSVVRVPNFPVANGKGQRAWLEKWIYAIRSGRRAMPPRTVEDKDLIGWTRCSWWETMDELGELEFSLVAHNLFTPRNALQMSPSLAEMAIVTVVARADAAPGVRQLVLVDRQGASAPRPLLVTAEPHVAEPLYVPPPRKKDPPAAVPPPVADFPVVLDGQILPGETDVFRLALRQGDVLRCLLTGREFTPYLGDAVPGFFNPVLRLTDADGRELAFADDYGALPDPVLACEIPSNGVYRLEVRDNLYRGRADFVYSVACFTDGRDLPSVSERTFAVGGAPTPVENEAECLNWRDTLAEPRTVRTYDFEVARPGEWQFDLRARRRGSPLDGVVKLYGPLTGWFWKDGPLLATWDDVTNTVFVGRVPQAECDPEGRWTFAEPGDYRLTVEDRTGAGGEDFAFELTARPTRPSLAVYAKKSSFVLPPGREARLRFKVNVVRQGGLKGPVTLEGGAAFRLAPRTLAATTTVATVTAEPLVRDWTGMKSFAFTASAETADGQRLTVPIVPADEMEQAFAYTHLLPTESFRVFVHAPDVRPAERPQWIEMPYDRFLPRRVIQPEVLCVEPPADVGEGVLRTKLEIAEARVRQRPNPATAYEGCSAAAAVLAGVSRFIDRERNYADGDARRVRTMARAAERPADNDILVYVPTAEGDPLKGPAGAVARRLRARGWSFDFVTDRSAGRAPCGRIYKAVVVPAGVTLSESARQTFEGHEKKRNFSIVEEAANAPIRSRLVKRCRRDVLPEGVLFARYGQDWGEGWYFVHNPTDRAIGGAWRFAIRGWPRAAFAMDVETGDVKALAVQVSKGAPQFGYTLGPGRSAWIYVTVREEK